MNEPLDLEPIVVGWAGFDPEVDALIAEVVRLREEMKAVRMAPVALALLAQAWRHLRLDTPEDQELHQRLLDQTDATIRAAIKALDGAS